MASEFQTLPDTLISAGSLVLIDLSRAALRPMIWSLYERPMELPPIATLVYVRPRAPESYQIESDFDIWFCSQLAQFIMMSAHWRQHYRFWLSRAVDLK